MKKIIIFTIAVTVVIAGIFSWWYYTKKAPTQVTSFLECVASGGPIMESYPRQCRYGNETFTEDIGNEFDKSDIIRIDTPRPNEVISSPLVISGEARGSWYFEASFPITLIDTEDTIIAEGIAQAKSDWMTSEFVPFQAILMFTINKSVNSEKGSLILHKDNPSGLPEHDESLEVPVVFCRDTEPVQKACTQEAKICPDGSAVGRSGPQCEFSACPLVELNCLKDSDCPSSEYLCEATQGTGTICPSTDPTCISTHTIIAGKCKVREGYNCSTDSQCVGGFLCRNTMCTAPIDGSCTGENDMSCPTGYECKQGCGSPVSMQGELPPPYSCVLKGYNRTCPICLAKDTMIDTPLGMVPVQELQKGSFVWTTNIVGSRELGIVMKTSKTRVPSNHKMIKLVLDDGRILIVSPGHPNILGYTVGDLPRGDKYDGAFVVSAERITYSDPYTYDILPSGVTGFYRANGILLDSTLRERN